MNIKPYEKRKTRNVFPTPISQVITCAGEKVPLIYQVLKVLVYIYFLNKTDKK
jgi:hypothetical protein